MIPYKKATGLRFMVVVAQVLATALADTTVDLRFVTYNVQSFPYFLQKVVYVPNEGRIEYIPEQVLSTAKQHFRDSEPDFICFQEAFSKDMRNVAKDFSVNHGYHMVGPNPGNLFRRLQPINSGVILLSKTEFDHVEFHDYPIATTCGLDRFARKGFIYAETVKEGIRIGVIATHLQAEDSQCATKTSSAADVASRKQGQQLQFIEAFLTSDAFLDRNVDVHFLMGDLNLNSLDRSRNPNVINWDLVEPQLSRVKANPMIMDPNPDMVISSYNPDSNNYFQLLNPKKFPDPEHYDYVLALGDTDVKVHNQIVRIRQEGFGVNKSEEPGDLSDHHAVMAYAQVKNRCPASAA